MPAALRGQPAQIQRAGSPARRNSLLLAGDRLRLALAGAGVGVRALAANRQRAAMTQAAIAAEVHQALDVHRDFAAQIALDEIVAVDGLADLQDFGVGELVDAALGGDADLLADLLGLGMFLGCTG